MSILMGELLLQSTGQTLIMVITSCAIAILFGLPLGIFLLVTQKGSIISNIKINRCVTTLVNILRSIPFIILMVAITPLTHFITGTSIGTTAAIVPLAIAAIPFLARIIENAMKEVPTGLIEAAESMGATPIQTIRYVLLPEAMPGIIRGITLTLITLVGYSAMAGAVGGGGLGDLAIRYGYERFEVSVMLITVFILIILVQLFQWIGDRVAIRLSHNHSNQLKR